MDPVSEAVHITIEIELLCIVRSKPLPEAQLYLIIEFASGFFSAFQPCSRCQISSRSIFFSCRMFSPPFLEQNECNLYSFYKVKYFFIEIEKSFLMKMSPPPYRHIERMREIFFVRGQTNNVRKAASGKHRTSHDLE